MVNFKKMDKNKCPIFKSGTFSFCKKTQKTGLQHNAAKSGFGKPGCDDKKKWELSHKSLEKSYLGQFLKVIRSQIR